jgi:two-component system LytT family sensor kinase
MKINAVILFVVCSLLSVSSFAQRRAFEPFGNKFNFEFWGNGEGGLNGSIIVFVPDTAIYKAFNKSSSMKPKSKLLLGVKLNARGPEADRFPVKSLSKSYSGYVISDGSEATIVAMGINKDNAKEFEYHVMENDSVEIIPWSKIPKLAQQYGAREPYGFIGTFKSPGKQLIIEVRSIKDYNVRDGIIFDWRTDFKPKLEAFTVLGRKDKKLFHAYLGINELNEGLASRFDPITKAPLDLKFPLGRVRNFQLYLKDHQQVPFDITVNRLDKSQVIAVYHSYSLTDNYKDILLHDFDDVGKFEIVIGRSESIGVLSEDNLLRIPFEITSKPLDERNISAESIILLGVLLAILAGIAFSIYSRRNKRKLQKLRQDQQIATLKLKSIRSQLNPHFMFNALTSIQNLINKNNIPDANFYLSKFADLTRQVLDTNNENLISLEDEIKMLTDYLEMEKLRFDFTYELAIDPALNLPNIDVPAMLLQPFIENAVKHGVSGLKHGGLIKIHIKGVGTHLEMSVLDNGIGYNTDAAATGYGIKLSEERVELLNQLYKDQSISLTIKSTPMGTSINFHLSNWIS